MGLSLRTFFSGLKAEATKSSDRVVGIDIGSASIKVVELEYTDKAPILRTYGELQLGPYDDKALGVSVQLQLKKRIEALVDVWREAGVVATEGVFALPLHSSFVTVIPVDMQKNETLETRIPVEARKYIPVPLNEITLDWVSLPLRNGQTKHNPEVLLVALLNEALSETNNLLQQVSLKSDQKELEVFSLMRSIEQTNCKKYACLDLGANSSRLYIVSDDLLERIHRAVVGGTAITEQLGTLLALSFEEAEQIKRSQQQTEDVVLAVRKATALALEASLQEFKRVIDQYEIKRDIKLEKVFITGGVAATPHITEYVRELFQREVEVLMPFAAVAYPAFMEETLKEIGPTFSVSLGAALRQME